MPRGPSTSLLSLPQGVLERCLALCDQPTRAGVLPLVCRAFRRLLAGPSACLWASITYEADLSLPGQPERASAFLAWLARHGALSKTVQLDLWSGAFNAPVAFQPGLPLGEQLEDALRVSLGSCEYLRLRWGGQQLVLGDWIAGARALTCLAVSAHDLDVHANLAALTSLVHLELSTSSDNGPLLDPACLPTTLTRLCCVPAPGEAPADGEGPVAAALPEQLLALPRLHYLDVSESRFDRAHLEAALPRLTRLTSLALDKCEMPDGLPPQLSLLTALRVLSFDGCVVLEGHPLSPVAWTALGALTSLRSLSLSNCSLLQLPASVPGLPRMQHLYLEYNAMRALPPGPYLRRLRLLSLDWEPLLRCHAVLLPQAHNLEKLALGNMSIYTHDAEGLPPLSSTQGLLASLRGHTTLGEVLLITRPTHLHGAFLLVMEAILELRGLRPGLGVRPIEHDSFFVEDAPPSDLDDDDDPAEPAAGSGAAGPQAGGQAGSGGGGGAAAGAEAAPLLAQAEAAAAAQEVALAQAEAAVAAAMQEDG
ncbi:hypothetical protein ABPG75_010530 [Micractinium tetrahymenae]